MKEGLKKILEGDDSLEATMEAYTELPEDIKYDPSKIELLLYIAGEIKKEKESKQ